MKYLPFSVYEILGYIASGFLFIISVDYLFCCNWLIGTSIGFLKITFWTSIALIVGHILGGLSYWLYEQKLIKQQWGLGYPSKNLFAEKPPKYWSAIIKEYFKPLPKEIQEKIIQKSGGWENEALFLKAFSCAIQNKPAHERIINYLNQYGLCRNISFTSLLVTLIYAWGYFTFPHSLVQYANLSNKEILFIGLCSLSVSLFMFYRFLKFYRAFSKETFVYYAFEVPEEI